MNADTEQAIAWLTQPSQIVELEVKKTRMPVFRESPDVHWRWRLQAAEAIAAQIDPRRFGLKAFYVFGSANNATAGPESDIDVLIHFQGSQTQRQELLAWLEGWSLALAEVNYLRTGHRTVGLLDVHLITDEDIRNRSSYALKIGAVSDAARPLAMGTARPENGD
jgi:pyruvate,water dikinase